MNTETHINESILSDEIREHQKENRIDHMTYLPDMEDIGSDVMDQVISAMNAYNYDIYTENDVRRALSHDNRSLEDFKALLSPAALPLLEDIAQAAQAEALLPDLTPEELAVYRRGRNAHSHSVAKNASVGDYRRATGLEALCGYLYLSGQEERLLDLIKTGLERTGEWI